MTDRPDARYTIAAFRSEIGDALTFEWCFPVARLFCPIMPRLALPELPMNCMFRTMELSPRTYSSNGAEALVPTELPSIVKPSIAQPAPIVINSESAT